MKKHRDLIAAVLAYFALALLCLLAPRLLPDPPLLSPILYGPPALLLWGPSAWPPFAFFTTLLALLLACARRYPSELDWCTIMAVLIWLFAGWFSAIASI